MRDRAAMHVLIVDHVQGAARIRRELLAEGIAADVAIRADDALWMARAMRYDAIILDATRSEKTAISTCLRLRRADVWRPVLLLTLGPGDADIAAARRDVAADDLAVPFTTPELAAKLHALARRGAPARPAILRAGQLELDPATRRVARGGQEIGLSAREFAVLDVLMRQAGHVVDRGLLRRSAWGEGAGDRSNVVDVYVRYVREKVDRPFAVVSIETVRGAGYRMRLDGGRPAPAKDESFRRARGVHQTTTSAG